MMTNDETKVREIVDQLNREDSEGWLYTAEQHGRYWVICCYVVKVEPGNR